MSPYVEILRPGTSLLAALGAVIGAIIAGVYGFVLFYIFLAVFLIAGAGMVINDYYDIEIDRINAPFRPLPSGRISRKNALIYCLFLFSLGLFFSALLNLYCFLLALFNSILEFLYAKRFKRTFLFGNFLVSYFTASTFIFGSFLTLDFKITWILALLAFLANTGREIFKAIDDIRGDKKMKLETLPIVSGVRTAREIAQGFIASAILLSSFPYFSGLLEGAYLKIVSISNFLFLYSFSKEPSEIRRISKIAMYITLLAFLMGAKIR